MLWPSVSAAETALGPDWVWPHFTIGELACRCEGRFCEGAYWHEPAFLDALEQVRGAVGHPLVINSAHRCAQWNAAVGGAPLSRHKRMAVDISLRGHDRFALRAAAERAGFTGFGLARGFLHLDRRVVPAVWYYGRSGEAWVKS